MRDFFLGNTRFTGCGASRSGPGGIAYFCETCGEVWGKSRLGWSSWLASNQPCEKHGNKYQIGGSFFRQLVWWDNANGNTLPAQLANASPELIRYEAEKRANWLKERGYLK